MLRSKRGLIGTPYYNKHISYSEDSRFAPQHLSLKHVRQGTRWRGVGPPGHRFATNWSYGTDHYQFLWKWEASYYNYTYLKKGEGKFTNFFYFAPCWGLFLAFHLLYYLFTLSLLNFCYKMFLSCDSKTSESHIFVQKKNFKPISEEIFLLFTGSIWGWRILFLQSSATKTSPWRANVYHQ